MVGITRVARVTTGAGIVIVAKIARTIGIARVVRAEYVAVEEARVVAIKAIKAKKVRVVQLVSIVRILAIERVRRIA
jgi:hypothetical protein